MSNSIGFVSKEVLMVVYKTSFKLSERRAPKGCSVTKLRFLFTSNLILPLAQ